MTITIEEGLTLNNPTAKIKSVQYEQFNNLVNVEIYFVEEGSSFTHSRNYTFTNDDGEDLSYSDVILLIKTNDVLNKFF